MQQGGRGDIKKSKMAAKMADNMYYYWMFRNTRFNQADEHIEQANYQIIINFVSPFCVDDWLGLCFMSL